MDNFQSISSRMKGLTDPARVAKAVSGVFRAASMAHGGIIYWREGVQQKYGDEAHDIPVVLQTECDNLVRAGLHPALPLARNRLTPFELIAIGEADGASTEAARFANCAREEGYSSVYIVPLWDVAGDQFIASGLRRTPSITEIEARLVQSFCLDALVAMEKKPPFSSESRQPLTPRERECLVAAGGGKTEKETARLLGISPATVHAHLESIKKKLGAKTKIEGIVLAIQLGIIKLDEL